MGTNYYLVYRKERDVFTIFHLGKMSLGWQFCWQGYKQSNLCTEKQIRDFLKLMSKVEGFKVQDEYGKFYRIEEFLADVREWNNSPNNDKHHCQKYEGRKENVQFNDFS